MMALVSPNFDTRKRISSVSSTTMSVSSRSSRDGSSKSYNYSLSQTDSLTFRNERSSSVSRMASSSVSNRYRHSSMSPLSKNNNNNDDYNFGISTCNIYTNNISMGPSTVPLTITKGLNVTPVRRRLSDESFEDPNDPTSKKINEMRSQIRSKVYNEIKIYQDILSNERKNQTVKISNILESISEFTNNPNNVQLGKTIVSLPETVIHTPHNMFNQEFGGEFGNESNGSQGFSLISQSGSTKSQDFSPIRSTNSVDLSSYQLPFPETNIVSESNSGVVTNQKMSIMAKSFRRVDSISQVGGILRRTFTEESESSKSQGLMRHRGSISSINSTSSKLPPWNGSVKANVVTSPSSGLSSRLEALSKPRLSNTAPPNASPSPRKRFGLNDRQDQSDISLSKGSTLDRFLRKSSRCTSPRPRNLTIPAPTPSSLPGSPRSGKRTPTSPRNRTSGSSVVPDDYSSLAPSPAFISQLDKLLDKFSPQDSSPRSRRSSLPNQSASSSPRSSGLRNSSNSSVSQIPKHVQRKSSSSVVPFF